MMWYHFIKQAENSNSKNQITTERASLPAVIKFHYSIFKFQTIAGELK